MAETSYYDSPMTGEELDAAFAKMANIDQSVLQASQSAAEAETQAERSAQSAQTAESSMQDAQQRASQAEQSAKTASASAEAAEQSAQDARQQTQLAEQSAGQAAASAESAAASLAGIGDNLEKAETFARQAEAGAAAAEEEAQRAESAAQRAEEIADFDPAQFATAEQGTKADSAVQSVNGIRADGSGNVALDLAAGTVRSVNSKSPDGAGNVLLSAGDVGAATYAQGALADTAVQPADLEPYAEKTDIPDKLASPQALSIRLGENGQQTSYDGATARSVVITPEAIGAQPVGATSAIVVGESEQFDWANNSSYSKMVSGLPENATIIASVYVPYGAVTTLQGSIGFVIAEPTPGTYQFLGYNATGKTLTGCTVRYTAIPRS